MADVEKSVGSIIEELERKATDAEQRAKTMEARLENAENGLREAERESQSLKQRVEGERVRWIQHQVQ